MLLCNLRLGSRLNQLAKGLFSLLLTVCLPLVSLAHGYWFDPQGTGKIGQPVRVQICFGEIGSYVNYTHRARQCFFSCARVAAPIQNPDTHQ